jgi:hypothetical protein
VADHVSAPATAATDASVAGERPPDTDERAHLASTIVTMQLGLALMVLLSLQFLYAPDFRLVRDMAERLPNGSV